IEQAAKNVQPATLSAGSTEQLDLAFNRRFHMKDGTVRFNPGRDNPDVVRPAGPIDPAVNILRIADATGRTRAVVSNFALHLDTLGGTESSADYPYYLQQQLQAAVGHEIVSIFATGTCGDINHINIHN